MGWLPAFSSLHRAIPESADALVVKAIIALADTSLARSDTVTVGTAMPGFVTITSVTVTGILYTAKDRIFLRAERRNESKVAAAAKESGGRGFGCGDNPNSPGRARLSRRNTWQLCRDFGESQ